MGCRHRAAAPSSSGKRRSRTRGIGTRSSQLFPEHGGALACGEAEPSRRPAADLDPGSRHDPIAGTGTGPDRYPSWAGSGLKCVIRRAR